MAEQKLYAVRLKDGTFEDVPRLLWPSDERWEAVDYLKSQRNGSASNQRFYRGARVVSVRLVEDTDGR